jgi:hypothetical protein
VAQEAGRLLCKREVLRSNSSPTKEKTKTKTNNKGKPHNVISALGSLRSEDSEFKAKAGGVAQAVGTCLARSNPKFKPLYYKKNKNKKPNKSSRPAWAT